MTAMTLERLENGGLPDSIWITVQPTDQMSAWKAIYRHRSSVHADYKHVAGVLIGTVSRARAYDMQGINTS